MAAANSNADLKNLKKYTAPNTINGLNRNLDTA